MTKTDAMKRINKAIDTLNKMDNNVCFSFEEDSYGINVVCKSRIQSGLCFGAYGYNGIFDEYKKKIDVYTNCMLFLEMMIAATKLNNPKAYHNLV